MVKHGLPAIGYDSGADRQSWEAMVELLEEVEKGIAR